MGGVAGDKHSSPSLPFVSVNPPSHIVGSQYDPAYAQIDHHPMNDIDDDCQNIDNEIQLNGNSEPVIYSILQDSHYGDDLSFSRSESCLITRSSSSTAVHNISDGVDQKSSKHTSSNYRDFAMILFKLHKQEQGNLRQQNIQLEDRLGKLLAVLRKKQEIPNNELTLELEQEVERLTNRIQLLDQWKETVSREILSKMEMNLTSPESSLDQIKQLVQHSGLDPTLNNIILRLLSGDINSPDLVKSIITDIIQLSKHNGSTFSRVLKSLDKSDNDIRSLVDNIQDDSLRQSFIDCIQGNNSDESFIRVTLTNYDSLLQDHKELLLVVRDAYEKMQSLECSINETNTSHKQELSEMKAKQQLLEEQCKLLEKNSSEWQQECESLKAKMDEQQHAAESTQLSLIQKEKQDIQDQLTQLQSEHEKILHSNKEKLDALVKENAKLKKSCEEWKEKGSKWEEESERLSKTLIQIEQQQKSNSAYKDKISDLEKYQQELELKLNYLKNSFIQFARHRERQDALLPVIATILDVSLEDFQPPNCGIKKSDNINESDSVDNNMIDETTTVEQNQQDAHFWPFW